MNVVPEQVNIQEDIRKVAKVIVDALEAALPLDTAITVKALCAVAGLYSEASRGELALVWRLSSHGKPIAEGGVVETRAEASRFND